MIYLLGGLALVAALLGLWGDVQHQKVKAAEAKVELLQSTIDQQNAAVAATKADGDRRVAQATAGAARARQDTAQARSDAERLRQAGGVATPAGSCPEAIAVAEVKKGLRP